MIGMNESARVNDDNVESAREERLVNESLLDQHGHIGHCGVALTCLFGAVKSSDCALFPIQCLFVWMVNVKRAQCDGLMFVLTDGSA